jgi:hypothetical protein
MFDDMEDHRADSALHAGLRDLPTPETSADFETRILVALTPRQPWWQTAWSAVRPALPTALCGLTAMLLLLNYAQKIPNAVPSLPATARDSVQRLPSAEACGGTPEQSSLESLESIDLNSASLSFFSYPIRRSPGKCG